MKGITRIELHFEKVILALLTIAMVGLLSLDFLNPIIILQFIKNN